MHCSVNLPEPCLPRSQTGVRPHPPQGDKGGGGGGLEFPSLTSGAWEGREGWGRAFQARRPCRTEEEEVKVAGSP